MIDFGHASSGTESRSPSVTTEPTIARDLVDKEAPFLFVSTANGRAAKNLGSARGNGVPA